MSQTPSQRRGFVVGEIGIFTSDNNMYGTYRAGDKIKLTNDDGSHSPWWTNLRTHEQLYINLQYVENITQGNNKAMTQAFDFKELAITTFGNIVERAKKYRAGVHQDSDHFRPRYGICDNVYLCMPQEHKERYHDQMIMVKDNLIRQVPSYSGAYHYPVRAPQLRADETMEQGAERYWDNQSDKWEGDYGAERLIQAQELLDMVTNNWDDSFIKRMTPAQRVGITEGVVVQHVETSEYFVISRDDDSSDPYFIPYGDNNTDNRRSIRLSELKVVRMADMPKRSVLSLVNSIKKQVEKRAKLEAQVKELQKLIAETKGEQAMYEFALAQQHSVKLINR